MIELINVDDNHTDFILSIINDEKYSNGFPRRKKITREDHNEFLKVAKDEYYYLIKCDGNNAGLVSIYNIDIDNRRAEWGRFIIVDKFKAIGLPVAKMMIKKAFDELNLNKLYCQILSTNFLSLEFNEALGFRQEGLLKYHYFIDNSYVHIYYLAKYKGQ